MTVQDQETKEKITVVNADDMSLENFAAHMELRHSGSLGGTSRLPTRHMTAYSEELWRTFHDKLHNEPLLDYNGPFDHDHRERRK